MAGQEDRFGRPVPADPGYKEIINSDGSVAQMRTTLFLDATLTATDDPDSDATRLSANGGGAGTITRTVDTVSDLRGLSANPSGQYSTLGRFAAGDGGHWSYDWNAGSTATDDGVLVIKVTSRTTGRFLSVKPPDGIMNALACGPALADGSRTKSFDPSGVVAIGSECFRITGLLADAGWLGLEFPNAGATYRHSGSEQIASRPPGQGFYYGSKSGALVTGNEGRSVAPMGLGAYSRGVGDTGTTATLIECDHAGSVPFNMTLNGGERVFTGFADTSDLAEGDVILMYFGAETTDFTGTGSCAILMRATIASLTGTTITTFESMPGALPITSGTRGPQTKHSVRKLIGVQDGLVISGFRFRNVFVTCQYTSNTVIDCHWEYSCFAHNHTGCEGMVIPRLTAETITGYDPGGGGHYGGCIALQACYATQIGLLRIGNLDGVFMVDEELSCRGTHIDLCEVNWNALNSITTSLPLFVSSGINVIRIEHLVTFGGWYNAAFTQNADVGLWEDRGSDNGNGSINASAGQANRLVFHKQGYREKQVVERMYPLTPSAAGQFKIGVGGLIRNFWFRVTSITGITYMDVNGGTGGTTYPVTAWVTDADKWIQVRPASQLSISAPNWGGYNFPGIRVDCDGTMPAGNFIFVKVEMFLPELETPQPLAQDESPVPIRTGSGAPSMDARWINDEYIDYAATPRKIYRAVNIGTGASDWVALN